MENTETSIKKQWETLKAEKPKLRIRDAAKELGCSEAELLSAGVGQQNTLLQSDVKQILKEMELLGEVMALTRNDHCVHERKGVYKKASFNAHVGLVVTPDIDLRMFMSHWHIVFAVNENNRLSLQFFDEDGSAVHKIYLTEDSNTEAYHALVEKHKNVNQTLQVQFKKSEHDYSEKPDNEINIKAFNEAWISLQDTHEFHGLLKQYGLTRKQALRLAPNGYASQLSLENLKDILKEAVTAEVPIMVFTGNAGCIQIHTGEIKNILQTGPWFNILDPKFNMHLNQDGIASIWLVKKPTNKGLVHSLEIYDTEGNTIVQFFGKRKPNIPELESWRNLLPQIS